MSRHQIAVWKVGNQSETLEDDVINIVIYSINNAVKHTKTTGMIL